MSRQTRARRSGAIAGAIEAGEWDRLTVALALAVVRLLETLPPDMAPELLALLVGEPFDGAQHRPFDAAQGDRYAR